MRTKGLQLAQLKLSHERFMDESSARIRQLEAEVIALEKTPVLPTPEQNPKVTTNTSRWKFW